MVDASSRGQGHGCIPWEPEEICWFQLHLIWSAYSGRWCQLHARYLQGRWSSFFRKPSGLKPSLVAAAEWRETLSCRRWLQSHHWFEIKDRCQWLPLFAGHLLLVFHSIPQCLLSICDLLYSELILYYLEDHIAFHSKFHKTRHEGIVQDSFAKDCKYQMLQEDRVQD